VSLEEMRSKYVSKHAAMENKCIQILVRVLKILKFYGPFQHEHYGFAASKYTKEEKIAI
jgi:hypothetical protein